MIKISVAVVAGEVSGDKLGSALLKSLKSKCQASNIDIEFWGVGGEEMIASGLQSLYPMDDIAVMGIIEPVRILPQLIRRKNQTVTAVLQRQPDVYIGIDSPDFTLRIAKVIKARSSEIAIVHYVSPSVWAWRQNRIYGIKAAVDLMITLFPFESAFYNQHQVANICVGHSMAESLPLEFSKTAVRDKLEISASVKVVALLPGSRISEVERHLALYLETAKLIAKQIPCRFLIPVAKASLKPTISSIIANFPDLHVQISEAESSDILQASDIAIVTSGTATLEALLCQCPIVVGYKTSAFTYAIAKRLVKSKFIALPNLLNQSQLVPEFIQSDCTDTNLANAALNLLTDNNNTETLKAQFREIHRQLQLGGSDTAANEILNLISSKHNVSST
jgi:lipid-A-disaccharide synthase